MGAVVGLDEGQYMVVRGIESHGVSHTETEWEVEELVKAGMEERCW